MTIFDTQVSYFIMGLPFSDGTKIEFTFTIEYLYRFVMKYLSDYWGIDDRKLNREIFGKYFENLSRKLPLLKNYIDERYWQGIKLGIKHI